MFLEIIPVSSSKSSATFSPIPPSLTLSNPFPSFKVFFTIISPSFGFAPSDTTTILNFLPCFFLSFIFSTTLFISYGISGINATSAPPAIADSSAIHPAYLPITSNTIILWCDSAVECNLSKASVATDTAVLYPNVISQCATSLSIVFGTPITFNPFIEKSLADFCVPSPPNVKIQSNPAFFTFSIHSSETSLYTVSPFSSTFKLNRFVLLEEPIIVPPLCNSPDALPFDSSFI